MLDRPVPVAPEHRLEIPEHDALALMASAVWAIFVTTVADSFCRRCVADCPGCGGEEVEVVAAEAFPMQKIADCG